VEEVAIMRNGNIISMQLIDEALSAQEEIRTDQCLQQIGEVRPAAMGRAK
jgi:hypothetical protein